MWTDHKFVTISWTYAHAHHSLTPTCLARCTTQSSSFRMMSYFGHPGHGHVMPINVDVTFGRSAGTVRFPIAANYIAKAGSILRCSGSGLGLLPLNHVIGSRFTALSPTTVAVYHSIPLTFRTSRTALLRSPSSHRSSMTSTIGRTLSHHHLPTFWKSHHGYARWHPTSRNQSECNVERCNIATLHLGDIGQHHVTSRHNVESFFQPRHHPTMPTQVHHQDSAQGHLPGPANQPVLRTGDLATSLQLPPDLRPALAPRHPTSGHMGLNALQHLCQIRCLCRHHRMPPCLLTMLSHLPAQSSIGMLTQTMIYLCLRLGSRFRPAPSGLRPHFPPTLWPTCQIGSPGPFHLVIAETFTPSWRVDPRSLPLSLIGNSLLVSWKTTSVPSGPSTKTLDPTLPWQIGECCSARDPSTPTVVIAYEHRWPRTIHSDQLLLHEDAEGTIFGLLQFQSECTDHRPGPAPRLAQICRWPPQTCTHPTRCCTTIQWQRSQCGPRHHQRQHSTVPTQLGWLRPQHHRGPSYLTTEILQLRGLCHFMWLPSKVVDSRRGSTPEECSPFYRFRRSLTPGEDRPKNTSFSDSICRFLTPDEDRPSPTDLFHFTSDMWRLIILQFVFYISFQVVTMIVFDFDDYTLSHNPHQFAYMPTFDTIECQLEKRDACVATTEEHTLQVLLMPNGQRPRTRRHTHPHFWQFASDDHIGKLVSYEYITIGFSFPLRLFHYT